MSQILKQADRDFNYNQHVKVSHGKGQQLTWTDGDGSAERQKVQEKVKWISSRKKKILNKTKNKQKHMISKMKTSFSGLTSKLDTEEQVSLSQQRYLQGSRHGSNLSFNSWMNG